MKSCPKCNASIEDNLNFCSNCGANLKVEMSGNMQNQSFIPNNPSIQPYSANPIQQPPNPTGNPYYQQQPPAGGSYYQQQPGNFQQNPNYTGNVNRPVGITLISIYEIVLGAILGLIGVFLFSLSNNINVQLNSALSGTNYSAIFEVLGVIFVALGVLGIVGAILFLQWKNSGYIISLIFLIIQGILLFAFYLIPVIALVASLIYFFSNQNFKNTFNYMKNTRR